MEPANAPGLTESEQRMWSAVMAGHVCVFGDDDPRELASPDGWGPERTIRGWVLTALLAHIGETKPPAIRRVQIQGARVIGKVDLSHAELTSVFLVRCLFEDDLDLWLARARTLVFETCVLASVNAAGASISGPLVILQSLVRGNISLNDARISQSVVLSGSRIVGVSGLALTADGLAVTGDVSVDKGFRAIGSVQILGARISGSLIGSSGRFENPGGRAIAADGAVIGVSIFLNKAPGSATGFLACGTVQLTGVKVTGQLDCSGGQFYNPGGHALVADGAEIGAGVFLSKSPRDAAGFCASGEVRLAGARIVGQLNCSGGRFDNGGGLALAADGAEVRGDVLLGAGFHATGEVGLPNAQIKGTLICSGGRFDNPKGTAFAADGADIRGRVHLGTGFHATGVARLPSSRIDGPLVCSGGRFDNPKGIAFAADGAVVHGNLHLDDGFHATGEVRLPDAQITGRLICASGRFDNPSGDALIANRADIQGDVSLVAGFHATGAVWQLGARIGGQLNCSGGRFDNPNGIALVADGVETGVGIFLGKIPGSTTSFHATGEVRLLGARVGASLDCAGGRFDAPKGIALNADGVDVRDNVHLGSGFHATGATWLPGARVGGQLNCAGGRFDNSQVTALTLHGAHVDSLWLRDLHARTAGWIDLSDAKVALLADDAAAVDIEGTLFRLDGFVYERIAPDSPRDVSTRLRWLERQSPGYHPQPFDQLAAVFQRNGQDDEAKQVLIAKRRKRRETLPGWWRRWGDWFLDFSMRYGWQPWRPLAGGLVVFLMVLGLVIGAERAGLVISLSDQVSPYSSMVHALDVFLPIVDLGVESRWTIDTANSGRLGWLAWLVTSCLWFLKLVGWGTVTLAVAAFTGIVKRE